MISAPPKSWAAIAMAAQLLALVLVGCWWFGAGTTAQIAPLAVPVLEVLTAAVLITRWEKLRPAVRIATIGTTTLSLAAAGLGFVVVSLSMTNECIIRNPVDDIIRVERGFDITTNQALCYITGTTAGQTSTVRIETQDLLHPIVWG